MNTFFQTEESSKTGVSPENGSEESTNVKTCNEETPEHRTELKPHEDNTPHDIPEKIAADEPSDNVNNEADSNDKIIEQDPEVTSTDVVKPRGGDSEQATELASTESASEKPDNQKNDTAEQMNTAKNPNSEEQVKAPPQESFETESKVDSADKDADKVDTVDTEESENAPTQPTEVSKDNPAVDNKSDIAEVPKKTSTETQSEEMDAASETLTAEEKVADLPPADTQASDTQGPHEKVTESQSSTDDQVVDTQEETTASDGDKTEQPAATATEEPSEAIEGEAATSNKEGQPARSTPAKRGRKKGKTTTPRPKPTPKPKSPPAKSKGKVSKVIAEQNTQCMQ